MLLTAISRMLRYGAPKIMGEQDAAEFSTSGGGDFPGGEELKKPQQKKYQQKLNILWQN
jgi:hypothetical protein